MDVFRQRKSVRTLRKSAKTAEDTATDVYEDTKNVLANSQTKLRARRPLRLPKAVSAKAVSDIESRG